MPSLRGDLVVRINDGLTDKVVTRYCRGLKFTKAAPGGHQSLSFTMVLPRGTFTNLGPEDRVYVYDSRSGRTVIEGYLANPTPVDGPSGQQYDVTAFGGMVLASDEARALIYVDKNLDGWVPVLGHPDASTDQPNGGLRIMFQRGIVLGTGTFVGFDYLPIDRAGMQFAAVRAVTTSGKTDANYFVQFSDFTAGTFIGDTTPQMSTTGFDQTQWIGAAVTVGATKGRLVLVRAGGATTVGDDTTYTDFTGVSVLGRRLDRYGTALSTSVAHGSTALSVLASQVVEDLLGRVLTMCDPATAQVDATTYAIDQLAWPDGIKAADVFDRLSTFEPNLLWEILETLDNGKHRFNYRTWPTTPRYVMSVEDGWKQAGADVDLCNRILVSWTDTAGNQQVTTVTASSLGLTGIGLPVDALGSRIKDADPVSLPDGVGSSANATRIGGQILTDKINPPKAGSIVARRPVLDLLAGAMVMPWEIEAGYLCRIRETGDDLRITQVEYDDDSCSSVLQLGTPVLTIDQRVAKLARAS